jgi:hypothetical protein
LAQNENVKRESFKKIVSTRSGRLDLIMLSISSTTIHGSFENFIVLNKRLFRTTLLKY